MIDPIRILRLRELSERDQHLLKDILLSERDAHLQINWDKDISMVLFVNNVDKGSILKVRGTTFQKLLTDDYGLLKFLDDGDLQCMVEDEDGNELLHAFHPFHNVKDYFSKIRLCSDAELSKMAMVILDSLYSHNLYLECKLWDVGFEFYKK